MRWELIGLHESFVFDGFQRWIFHFLALQICLFEEFV